MSIFQIRHKELMVDTGGKNLARFVSACKFYYHLGYLSPDAVFDEVQQALAANGDSITNITQSDAENFIAMCYMWTHANSS